MNFKKYNEMELMMLASIATMSEKEVESIEMAKGDYTPVTREDCASVSFYISKPSSTHHALRRKHNLKKK